MIETDEKYTVYYPTSTYGGTTIPVRTLAEAMSIARQSFKKFGAPSTICRVADRASAKTKGYSSPNWTPDPAESAETKAWFRGFVAEQRRARRARK